MRKVLFLGAVALGVGACQPDIAQDDPRPADESVVAQFDPSASPAIVPSPNDLALDPATRLVNAPINTSAPAAEQEFTRDYINTLNGFPTTAIASTLVEDLDPRTVNENTVKFIDLYAGTILAKPATPIIAYNEDTNRINIIPPQPQGWPKGGRYAVAIIGGNNGVKTVNGKNVIASATWAFASSEEPLVTCQDLTAPNCRPTTELIPSTVQDPAERLADQTRSALRLEQLRRSYAPVLNQFASQFNIPRQDIVLMWTFTIMDHPEMTFDPASSTIPFPNDLLRVPAQGNTPARLNLPVPELPPTTDPTYPAVAQSRALIQGLNTLDGWSTTAPIVSENSPTRGAIDTGSRLDANTLKLGRNILFLKVTNPNAPTQPKVKVCLNCASSLRADGTTPSSPQQLQIVPEVPLDEATQYAVVVLRGRRNAQNQLEDPLLDERGRLVAPTGAQALLRLSAPLAVEGRSQVSAVPDGIAAQLEPVRAALQPLFDGLAAQGFQRKDVALAWAFTTQSTRSVLERLNAAPNMVPADPVYLTDQTAQLEGAMQASGLSISTTGRGFIGAFASPNLLDNTQGVLRPTPSRIDRIPFLLFVPDGQAPAGGFPVVVFGHGLTGNRTNVLGVVNRLNGAGYAVAAIDFPLHGDRSSCAGISAAAPIPSGDPANPIDTPDEACTAGSTCDVTATSPTFGRCIRASNITCDPRPTDPANPAAVHGDLVCQSQGEGLCVAQGDGTTGRCEGGDFRRASRVPVINAWNFLNLTNLFATRDNFRHSVVDLAQFGRALTSDSINARLTGAGAGNLNTSQVHYVGQSLGGMLGTLHASVNPRVRHVALNVAGGDPVGVLLTSTNETFVQRRQAFLAQLQAAGRVQGTPAFDEFITLARTILDPADPRNYGWFLENATSAPNGRQAFIQYIRGDEVIPNPLTEALIASANRDSQRTVQSYMFDIPVLPTSARHGFFSDPRIPESIRNQAQDQVIGFLNTGTAPAP
jgi:dienelactone hydrolase